VTIGFLKNGATKDHEEVCAALAEKGVIMLDTPASSGVSGAEGGALAVMVGGDPKTFEACQPFLQHIGANVFHVGDIGSGCVATLVNTGRHKIRSTRRSLSSQVKKIRDFSPTSRWGLLGSRSFQRLKP